MGTRGAGVDPVALDFDGRGALYATSTTRVNLPLDIRAHPSWVPMVHTLRTVDDLRAFYRRELAPERSATNTWLPDANNDGSRDWRDLAQMKERLYRIEDTNGDGIADRSQIMIEGFSTDPASDIAGGVLYHGGDLFLGASPALWRLRDSDGDGFIDSQVCPCHVLRATCYVLRAGCYVLCTCYVPCARATCHVQRAGCLVLCTCDVLCARATCDNRAR